MFEAGIISFEALRSYRTCPDVNDCTFAANSACSNWGARKIASRSRRSVSTAEACGAGGAAVAGARAGLGLPEHPAEMRRASASRVPRVVRRLFGDGIQRLDGFVERLGIHLRRRGGVTR